MSAIDEPATANRTRWPKLALAAVSVRTWIWIAVGIVGSGICIFLRSRVPFSLGLPSGQDARLFVRQATGLSRGHWLGPFDSLILAKGPSYPAFVATMYRLHVSLPVGDELMWLLAACSLAACVWVATRNLALSVIVYLVVAFDPASFSGYHDVVIRDGWYQSVSLLFVCMCFLAVRAGVNGARFVVVLALSLLAGLCGAAFWLCREEGAWVLPAVAVIVLGLPAARLLRRYLQRHEFAISRKDLRRRAGCVALAVLTLGLAFYLPIFAVMQANKSHYGVALSNDMTTGQFARAFSDWTRVKAGPARRDVPVNREQRQAVYEISSAARQLRASIESPRNPWMRFSCGSHRSADCDLSGAFTVWAMRDAALASGNFVSEPQFQAFFGQVARDIESSCSDSLLRCKAKLPVLVQPIQQAHAGTLLQAMQVSASRVFWSRRLYALPVRAQVLRPALRAEAAAVIRGFPSQARAIEQMNTFRAHIWPYQILIRVYQVLLPALVLLAIVAVIADVALRRSRASVLTVLGIALLVGAISRIFVFALVTVTQYSSAGDIRYQLPSHALLLSFAVIGTVIAGRVVSARWPLQVERAATSRFGALLTGRRGVGVASQTVDGIDGPQGEPVANPNRPS